MTAWHDTSTSVLMPTYQLGETPYTVEQRMHGNDFRFFAYYGPQLIGSRDGYPTETQAKVKCETYDAWIRGEVPQPPRPDALARERQRIELRNELIIDAIVILAFFLALGLILGLSGSGAGQ
jgi:hypothetical protein